MMNTRTIEQHTQSWRWFRKRDLALLALFYWGVSTLLYSIERHYVWSPVRVIADTPAVVPLHYEDVWFEASDGVRLHGWYYPNPGARASLLFCHGQGGNVSWVMFRAKDYLSLGLNVLTFDYRGYGKSGGIPSENGTYLDAQAAFDWLKAQTPGLPIIAHGWSLGSAIATHLAANAPVDGLINENGFTSIPEIITHHYPYVPARLILRTRYNALNDIRNVTAPTLVIGAPDDCVLPYVHSQRLYEAANEPKEFFSIRAGHDIHAVSRKEYIGRVKAFLDEYFTKS
ncbi:alpha/beta hydrolase [bacterium]|nr:alpha/beta hydrolase [bacterium]